MGVRGTRVQCINNQFIDVNTLDHRIPSQGIEVWMTDIVACVTQVINSIEIMKHKKRTWLDITIVCILDAFVLFIAGSIGYVWAR